MFDASVLNVFIGLILIFLLYSLLATALQEIISTLFARRAQTLYRGIRTMLTNTEQDHGLAYRITLFTTNFCRRFIYWMFALFIRNNKKKLLYEKFYDHPIIKNYGENVLFNKPSYLTASNFSTILIDTIKGLDEETKFETESFKLIRDNIYKYSKISPKLKYKVLAIQIQSSDNIIDYETFKILNYHLNESAGDLDVFRHRMERWFNDTMDRVSGWYKRSTQIWLMGIGIFLCVAFNLDTLEIANYLSKNKEAAAKLADMGTAIASNPTYSGNKELTQEIYDTLKVQVNQASNLLGLGWGDYGLSDQEFRNSLMKNPAYKTIYSDSSEALARFAKQVRKRDSLRRRSGIDSARRRTLEQEFTTLLKDSTATKEQLKFEHLYEKEGVSIKRHYISFQLGKQPGKWIGFLLSTIAISLGAPFWFDLLNKFISLRTAVKTVDSSGSTTKNNSVDNREIDG